MWLGILKAQWCGFLAMNWKPKRMTFAHISCSSSHQPTKWKQVQNWNGKHWMETMEIDGETASKGLFWRYHRLTCQQIPSGAFNDLALFEVYFRATGLFGVSPDSDNIEHASLHQIWRAVTAFLSIKVVQEVGAQPKLGFWHGYRCDSGISKLHSPSRLPCTWSLWHFFGRA